MKAIKYLLVLLGFYLPCALAATSSQTVNVSATGKTQSMAVAHALAEAVQQVNGVAVAVENKLVEKQPQVFINWLGESIVLPGGEINQGVLQTQALGPVESYKILSAQYLDKSKLWQVALAVTVLHYQALNPARSHLTTLAIAPFSSDENVLKTLLGAEPASQVAANLQQEISHSIVKTGRFRVLDRDFWPQLAKENSIIKNYSQANKEYIKQGQRLGADLLVVGNIVRFDLGKQSEQVYNSQNTIYRANFQIDVKVIETATAEVLFSDRVQLKLSHQQLQQWLQAKIQPLNGQYRTDVEDDIQQKLNAWIAQRIASEVVWHFYPVRVLEGGNQTVYLSQGDGLLAVGDSLTVYAAGKNLADKDTGLTIEALGDVIARVEVFDVESYYAKARVIEGDAKAIAINAVAKKQFPVLWQVEEAPAKPLTPGSSDKPLKWQ